MQQTALVRVYTTSAFPAARILLAGKHHLYIDEGASLSPTQIFSVTVALAAEELTSDLVVTVKDAHGRILVAYRPPRLPDAFPLMPLDHGAKWRWARGCLPTSVYEWQCADCLDAHDELTANFASEPLSVPLFLRGLS